ncbi:glycosyltransferase [Gordonia westfalica]
MRCSTPRVAIAHDYLTQRGGAEKVVLSLARAFPDAPIYTLLYQPEETYPEFREMNIVTSPLNRVALFRKDHRAALPILPIAASQMCIDDADIVVVSSSGWAHGFRTRGGRKLVYCYSPARWLYMSDLYLGDNASFLKRAALRLLGPVLRRWDAWSAAGCDRYLAISSVIEERIQNVYGMSSTIVPAPVHAPHDSLLSSMPAGFPEEQSFFLCISRLLAYKNVEAIVEAFRGTGYRLVIVGRGPEAGRLQSIKPDNVYMLKDLTDAEMGWLYENCTAVVAASYEDYGLTPLEGGMRGKPCAVLRWGGFLDTVSEDVNGVYFDRPEPELIRRAVEDLAIREWDPDAIRAHVDQFNERSFISRMRALVREMA